MPGDVVKKIEITAALSSDYQSAFSAAGNIARSTGSELAALSKREADLQKLAALSAQKAASEASGNEKAVARLSAQYDRLASRLGVAGKSASDIAGELSQIAARRGPLMELHKTASDRAELGKLARQIDEVSRAYAKFKDPALGRQLDFLRQRFRALGGDASSSSGALSSLARRLGSLPGPLGGLATSLSGLVGRLAGPAGIAAALGAVASAAFSAGKALFRMGLDAAQAGDHVIKTADALGISTDAFQELSYAMQRGGASESEFEAGIKSLQTQMAAAAAGNSRAVKAFGSLGISLSEVKSLNAEEMFARISDALSAVDDPALRVRTGIQLLGGAGQKLAAAMSDGSASLDALRARARDSGFVRTRKDLEGAASATDAFLDAQLSVKTSLQEIGYAVMPAVSDVLRNFADFVRDNREEIKLFATTLGNMAMSFARLFGTLVQKAGEFKAAYLRSLATVGRAFGRVRDFFTSIPKRMSSFKDSVVSAFSALGTRLRSLFDDVVAYIKDIPRRVKSSLADLPLVGGMFDDGSGASALGARVAGASAATSQIVINNNIDARGGDSETGSSVRRALSDAAPVTAGALGNINEYGGLAAVGS